MSTYNTDEFWTKYKEYQENHQGIHKRMVNMLLPEQTSIKMADIGCGRYLYGLSLFSSVDSYWGFDTKDVLSAIDPYVQESSNLIPVNYNKRSGWLDSIRTIINDCKLNTICAIFSIEPNNEPVDALYCYEYFFTHCPSLQVIVSSGFYYLGNEQCTYVEEESIGLVSYQTVCSLYSGDVFSEIRVQCPNPSKLFGPNVVDVWRGFYRK